MDLENILNTIQPFLVLFVAVFAAFLTATWISSVIWAFRDIRARTRDIFAQVLATLMVLIFFPLFPLPGLALYLILRPRETLAEARTRVDLQEGVGNRFRMLEADGNGVNPSPQCVLIADVFDP